MAYVLNTLVDALNERDRLPRFIIVMLDEDLIQDVGDLTNKDNVIQTLGKIVNWFT